MAAVCFGSSDNTLKVAGDDFTWNMTFTDPAGVAPSAIFTVDITGKVQSAPAVRPALPPLTSITRSQLQLGRRYAQRSSW